MAFTSKVLASGQLGAAKATIYTVPGATKAYVKYFSVVNTGVGSEVVKVYVNPAGTSRRIPSGTLASGESASLLTNGEVLILEAGDLIEAETTSAATVDYFICGVEET
jgi:hypothetical protein